MAFVSCSSDENDSPDTDKQAWPTQEEYTNVMADRLWEIEEARWVDDEGNIYPEMAGEAGFADDYAYYFLKEGYISFPGEYPFSMLFDSGYNAKRGNFCNTPDGDCTHTPQILSFNETEIILKDFVNVYRDNADSPRRNDVWRFQKYVLVENPDWETLYKEYTPLDYDPKDYGINIR